jgi:flagellin
MSLGVLNNLNAIYAENNLNNTNNSLSTVLNQLSLGSKINSGADDAAGLSLVDGLQANSAALAQSKTNASEGVGLLTVADGALSQVTNLLNRAVTLATEASNGTLNASQDTAANQEYQSILSEVNNIGTTTTYNNQAVFGKQTAIYTGDSSTEGSSIDKLDVSTLSSSNLGDTGGVMAYSSGSSNVFLNLSSSGQNAESTDSLNQSGATTINVNYLVKGANGTETSASTSISVGGTTGYRHDLHVRGNHTGTGWRVSAAGDPVCWANRQCGRAHRFQRHGWVDHYLAQWKWRLIHRRRCACRHGRPPERLEHRGYLYHGVRKFRYQRGRTELYDRCANRQRTGLRDQQPNRDHKYLRFAY